MRANNYTGAERTTRGQASGGCCGPVVPAKQEDLSEQVKLLSALADPTRLGIVQMLSGLDEPLCVCDIQSQFELGQPTISHHLKVLRDARLVNWEKRGLWVHYSLNRERLEEIASYLEVVGNRRQLAQAG